MSGPPRSLAKLPMLSVYDLGVRFDTQAGEVRAVDGVSLQVERGETVGLVGESGSGKSVMSLALMGLVPDPPGHVDSGRIFFHGRNLRLNSAEEMRRLRGSQMAMIFQDPMTSLNPLLTVGRQLTEVLEVHKKTPHAVARKAAAGALGEVGIPAPEASLAAYPHELSGGMRQRVMIAMALLCRPNLLIADEPTTALDVTIQAQILELMADLQKRHGMGILLITHDLGVVAGMADRVHVMYAGRIVEKAETQALFGAPRHPYTHGLLAAVPTLTAPTDQPLLTIEGQPPDLAQLPTGCAFEPRCGVAGERCGRERPALEALTPDAAQAGRKGHEVACFHPL